MIKWWYMILIRKWNRPYVCMINAKLIIKTYNCCTSYNIVCSSSENFHLAVITVTEGKVCGLWRLQTCTPLVGNSIIITNLRDPSWWPACTHTALNWPIYSPTWYHTLRWRHNDHAGVSNHQPHGCLLNRLFRRKSKNTSKLRVTGHCAGNSPGTGEFPAQMASYAENVSIWWRHHG